MIATTTQEIKDIVNKSFAFDVIKSRLRGPSGQPTDHFGLFRSDTGDCIGGAVSERYEPHTRDDVLAMVEAAATAFDGKKMVVATDFYNGHRVVIGPTSEDRLQIAKNDGIFPRFILTAGYDKMPFRSIAGAFRDACTNLQMLDSVSSTNESIRHTSSLRDKMPELIEMFGEAANNWKHTGEIAERMHQRQVDLVEFIRSVYPIPSSDEDLRSKRTETFYLNRVDKIVNRIKREALNSGLNADNMTRVVTAWQAYQGVQGFEQHDARRAGKPGMLKRAILALKSPNVAKALELATAS